MSFLARFGISTKILAIVVILSAISVAISWAGVQALRSINEDATAMRSAAWSALEASRANTSLLAMNQAAFSVALDPRPANRAEQRKVINEQLKLFNERIEDAGRTSDEKVIAMFPALKEATVDYLKDMESTLQLADGVTNVELSSETERVRASAQKSHATAEKLRTVVRKIALQLNDRVAHLSDAATEEYKTTSRWLVTIASVGVMLGLCAGFLVGQFGIARPIRALVALLQRLANGEDVKITGTGRKDEIGETARAVDGIKLMLAEKARQDAEGNIRRDRMASEMRKHEMLTFADEFEGAVGGIIEAVSVAATELEVAAGTLKNTAERTQQRSTSVAAASEQASANVQTVASASEELASSVNEIGRQVRESAKFAGEAVAQASKTNDSVTLLSRRQHVSALSSN